MSVSYTAEVLLTATPARIDWDLTGRGAIEIQNNGPNPILVWLGTAGNLASGAGRSVAASGGSWSIDATGDVQVFGCCPLGTQLTTAATIISQVLR